MRAGRNVARARPWLERFQLVQQARDRVVLLVTSRGAPPPEDLSELGELARSVLGPDVAFRIEQVDDLAPGPGGKFNVYHSLVDQAAPS